MAGSLDPSNLSYTVLALGNESDPIDPLPQDPNNNKTNVYWVLVSMGLVLLIIPGVAFFHSGLSRQESKRAMFWVALMSLGVISFQWFLWGYSPTSHHLCGRVIGNMQNIGFKGVLPLLYAAGDEVPGILFAVFQGMYAAITIALLTIAAIANRDRLTPSLTLILIWSTIINNPIAYWAWNPAGWVSDFVGGTPVHVVPGHTALAYVFMLSKSQGQSTQEMDGRAQDATRIIIGTVLLWIGSFGSSVGTACSANRNAAMAGVVTNISAGIGGVAWFLLRYWRERTWSSVGFCLGVISGLVAITPGSGFIPPWSAFIYGLSGAVSCYYATELMLKLQFGSPLDAFALHSVGGFVGNFMTRVLEWTNIISLDGTSVINVTIGDGGRIQLLYQLGGSIAGSFYVLGAIWIAFFVRRSIPVLSLRERAGDLTSGIGDVGSEDSLASRILPQRFPRWISARVSCDHEIIGNDPDRSIDEADDPEQPPQSPEPSEQPE